jgi:hypothetical protein
MVDIPSTLNYVPLFRLVSVHVSRLGLRGKSYLPRHKSIAGVLFTMQLLLAVF